MACTAMQWVVGLRQQRETMLCMSARVGSTARCQPGCNARRGARQCHVCRRVMLRVYDTTIGYVCMYGACMHVWDRLCVCMYVCLRVYGSGVDVVSGNGLRCQRYVCYGRCQRCNDDGSGSTMLQDNDGNAATAGQMAMQCRGRGVQGLCYGAAGRRLCISIWVLCLLHAGARVCGWCIAMAMRRRGGLSAAGGRGDGNVQCGYGECNAGCNGAAGCICMGRAMGMSVRQGLQQRVWGWRCMTCA